MLRNNLKKAISSSGMIVKEIADLEQNNYPSFASNEPKMRKIE
jgi:hypothetical protein